MGVWLIAMPLASMYTRGLLCEQHGFTTANSSIMFSPAVVSLRVVSTKICLELSQLPLNHSDSVMLVNVRAPMRPEMVTLLGGSVVSGTLVLNCETGTREREGI